MLFPFFWLVVTSLQTLAQSRTFGLHFALQFHNYIDAWTQAPFGRWLANTTIVSVTVVISNLVFCSLAGYALARMRFFGSGALFLVILATLMVPFQVVMVPTLLIVRGLGLVDTLPALMAPNLVTPFGVFLLRQFFKTMPVEIEEAARIDGAGRLGTLVKVVLPSMRAPLATVGIMTLLWTLERLSLAADRHSVREELHAAARPDDLSGSAHDQLAAGHGRHGHDADPHAGDLHLRPALVRAVAGDAGAEGVGWRRRLRG